MVRRVAASGVAVLYVTHRLDEVFAVASNATVLRDGREVVTTQVSGLTRAQLLHYLVGSELEEAQRESDALPPERDDAVLEVEDLSAGRLAGASFKLHPGEVVGVSGVTGSGREDLTQAIFGGIPRARGRVRLAGVELPNLRPDIAVKLGMAYLPPDRKRLGGLMELTARENLTISGLRKFWQLPRMRRSLEIQETAAWFAKLQVSPPEAFDQRLLAFSGGNQQKILLGKWLRLTPRVLLLDEPTQGVDVGAKAIIHHSLLDAAAAGAAVMINSVDIDELVALCHRVLIIRDGRFAAELAGERLTVPNVSAQTLAGSGTASHPVTDATEEF